MSDPERTDIDDGRLATQPPAGGTRPADGNGRSPRGAVEDWTTLPPAPGPAEEPPPRVRVKVKKLRLLAILAGLGVIAFLSTVFGMMMAVASDLPALEDRTPRNSVLVDRNDNELGMLTGTQRRIYLEAADIAPVMKQAIVAVEDQRFYTNEGVDLRGIGRALWADVRAKEAVQGGSTITQQFVKNALAAQDERTLFTKMREAALAFQITRKWTKQRILRNYLNTIYFGNGAYGIEAAARTYFGSQHANCGEGRQRKCAAQLEPHEAALLAGMVASPSGYDPLQHPRAAKARRDLVLERMVEQGFLTRPQRDLAVAEPVPTRRDVQPPREDTKYPYFTSWVKQQVVDKLGGGQTGARLAFEGGLTVKTTLDVKLQAAAEAAIGRWLANPAGPRASLVALDNRNGEVLAMVGGDDYATRPFNLATQGQRQPGSAFKPFVLAQALQEGISPNSTWSSRKLLIRLGDERFQVSNYEDAYAGITTLARATTFSDNSVYVQVARRVGPRKVARLARRTGIRTPVSRNLAIALGGLREGVTPIDMAHAYLTFARGGSFVYGTLSPGEYRGIRRPGPSGIQAIGRPDEDDRSKLDPVELPSGERAVNRPQLRRVLSPGVAGTVTSLLRSVVTQGTGTRAQVPGTVVAGKTGTTENYGDAWFVGWTPRYTVAVWVGYPDGLKPMKYDFGGEPVAGGTFPAAIFRSFVEGALAAYPLKKKEQEAAGRTAPAAPSPGTAAPAAPSPARGGGTPSGQGGDGDEEGAEGGGEPAPEPQPAEPVPQDPVEPPPAEQPPAAPPAGPAQPPAGAGAAPAPG